MLKQTLVKVIRLKNPTFNMDETISLSLIFSLVFQKTMQFLRSFKLLFFLKLPSKLFLGKNVQFFNISNMEFGKWVQLEDGGYLSALGIAPLTIGNNVRIGAYSRVIISTSFNDIGSHIKIGNNVGMGEFAYLGGAGGLEIGDDCIIGQYFSCHPENHNFEHNDRPIRLQGVNRQGIKIGKNCWIGSKVTILDGVEVGENCVIAAGAVVTKSMPPDSVIGGLPAKVLKSRLSTTSPKKEIVYA